MKNKILYMAALALAFTACSEEDIMQPANGQSGSLHISSVIIDGQQVARSRVVAENGGTYTINDLPANHSITGFSEGDEIQLSYSFEPVSWDDADDLGEAKARFDGSSWTLSGTEIMPATEESTFIIKPGNGEKWEYVKMYASVVPTSEGPRSLGRQAEGSNTTPQYVLGDIDDYDVWQVTDCLYASTEDGSITVDTDLNSPTLGAVTIRFKHQDALLRLAIPESGFNVAGTYVVDGTAYNVTGLATLWAFLDGNYFGWYVPFTQVGNNLQAIVYSGVSLTGFKAVLYATEVAAENTPMVSSTESEPSTITIDLPFKVGGSASNGIALEENTQYPLTLNISPASAEVNFTIPNGKPGWAVDEDDEEAEEELSNAENECDLSYITESNTFLVGSAEGLRNLNMWMMRKTSTENFKKQVNFVPANTESSFNINGGTSSAYAKNIKLMADITLPNTDINGNAITITDGVPSGSNWIPIGKGESTTDGPYIGVFDGNGKTIKNLTIVGSEDDLGLIHTLGKNGKGEVKNLTLENVTIKSSGVYIRYIGGIAGNVVANAKVSGCTVRGNLSGQYCKIGGIVGQNKGSITNCINYSEVSGNSSNRTMAYSSFSGGIAGDLTSTGAITGCTNFGNVNNYYAGHTGGIAGHSEGYITDCTTTEGVILTANCNGSIGTVFGVGGIVGKVGASSSFAFIQGCTNHATVVCEVETTFSVGGVVGFAESENNTIQIINNINKGNLFYNGNSGSPHVGGLVGYTSGNNVTAISGCINQGDVTYTSSTYYNYVGGIVGQLANSHYCVASGNTGNLSLTIGDGNHLWEGGIVGYGYDSKIIGCWTKDVGENEGTTAITQGKDGFGALGNSSIKEYCYIADSGDESAQKAFFDDGVVSNMNRAIIDFDLPNGVTKYYWVKNNGGWPALTTTAPSSPAQGN